VAVSSIVVLIGVSIGDRIVETKPDAPQTVKVVERKPDSVSRVRLSLYYASRPASY
jgi:hypothetical protein